jgi:TetR/AcrR family transcriptional regulator, cholesterol catabolism regulator
MSQTPPARTATADRQRRRITKENERRWDEIIHAAAVSFYAKGYEGASLQDVANEVGLLKGSIYYYIDSKEDLLFELVERAQAIAMETLDEGEALQRRAAQDRLRAFIRRWIALKNAEREWMIVAEREFMRLDQRRLKQVKANRRKMSDFVENLVRRGIEEGSFDPGLGVDLARDMVFELMKSSHLYRRPRSGADLDDLADRYATFALRGLGAKIDS